MRTLFLPIWVTRLLQGVFAEPYPRDHAPLDAKPCCQEAALRLIGRCDGACNSGSEVHVVLDRHDEQRDDEAHRT